MGILNYLNESYEYQNTYFKLPRTVFIPNIYRLKNDTFYVLKFIPQYEGKDRNYIIKQFQEKYPDIKMHVLTYKQYKRIVNWFKEKVELKNQVYYTNYQNTRVITQQCVHCGNRFQTNSKKNKFCSDQCATEYNARQEAIILAKRNYYNGYYMDIHHYVRSGWEHNFARILQWCQLDYDYEKYSFKLSDGSVYLPDFYVHADDTFYEIKGEMREASYRKIKLFMDDYPDKKLIVINEKIYRSLLEQFPDINFDLHYIAKGTKLRNIPEYRHDQVQYEDWELNYKYYSNRLYFDLNPTSNLISVKETSEILGYTVKQVMKLVRTGQIKYYYDHGKYLFDKLGINFYQSLNELREASNTAYSHKIMTKIDNRVEKKCEYCHKLFTGESLQKFCCKLCAKRALNKKNRLEKINQLNQSNSDIENKINLNWSKKKQTQMLHQNVMNKQLVQKMLQVKYDGEKIYQSNEIVNEIDWKDTYEEYRYIISKLIDYHIPFEFETEYTVLDDGKLLPYELYIPIEKRYYFCKFVHAPATQAKMMQLEDRDDIKFFTKPEYKLLQKMHVKVEKKVINNAICQYCSKPIPKSSIKGSYVPKYCSKECFYKAVHDNQIITWKCLNCGKEYEINKSDKGYKDFCSNECLDEYKLTHTVKEADCKYCGKHFYYVSKHEKVFCSYPCKLASSTKEYNLKCKCCGKIFRSIRKRQIFCSAECQHKYK